MSQFKKHIAILARDPRYSIQAYQFVVEALDELGAKRRKARGRLKPNKTKLKRPASLEDDMPTIPRPEKSSTRSKSQPLPANSEYSSGHVSGQMLCEAVRDLATRRFGMMAVCVFEHWGVRKTADIGEIVFNLIEIGDLQMNQGDSRSDFDNVFDFSTAFNRIDPISIED